VPAYLVTGGAGFIGSHIAEALLGQGASVTILDDLSSGRTANLAALGGGATFIEGDVRDGAAVRRALEGVEAVFHQAAVPSVVRSFDNPAETLSVNVAGTAELLETCRRMGVGKVVFASSSSVYGDSPSLPKEESMDPQPKSPYALSKLSCEKLLGIYADVYGMDTVALRYFNVFGPRQDPASEYAAVIPRFITTVLRGKAPTVFGDGLQTRDFAYIQNVVRANLLCLRTPNLRGEVINVACGERISLLDLLAVLADLTGRTPAPLFEPERAGDVKHSLASIEKAAALIGYAVEVPVREGLKRTLEYFMENLDE
jgi:nucleoside-diphosphate-sugar epimerase